MVIRLCTFLLTATCVFASQFTLVEFSTVGLDGNPGGPAPVYGPVLGTASGTLSGSSAAPDGSYMQTYSGSGSASIGGLHASVSESVNCLLSSCGDYALPYSSFEGSSDYEVGASALVWWNDIVTVTPGPGLASLNFVFDVDGTFSQSGSGNSSDTSALLVGEDCAATETLCTGGPPATPRHIATAQITQDGQVTINLIPWVLNQPFDYEFILAVNADAIPNTVGAQGYISGNSSATTDFSDTVQLVAVNPVDSAGNIVSGTTITSESGYDLPGSVPEPPTFGGAMAGLLLMLGIYSYRKACIGSICVARRAGK